MIFEKPFIFVLSLANLFFIVNIFLTRANYFFDFKGGIRDFESVVNSLN